MNRRFATTLIVVHASATPGNRNIGVHEIRQWHERKWSDIGYHYVIRRNGTIERGRDIWRQGAGVEGHNAEAIHICMVGGVDQKLRPEMNYNASQFASLKTLILGTMAEYPNIETVCGHRDLVTDGRACPCFDVAEWMRENGIRVSGA